MFRDRRSARPPRAPVGSPTTIHAGASALEVARRKREQARRLQQEAEQWELGAAGEQATAHELCRLPPSFVSLHDLSVPGSNANADHLVIGQSGLFMVDSKVASGRVPTRDGTLWRGRYPMRREFDTIRFEASRLANHLGVTVTPVVCFAAGELDRPDQVVDGIRVLQLDRLVPALAEPRHDALAAADVVRIADAARRLMRSAGPEMSPTHQALHTTQSQIQGRPVASKRRPIRRATLLAAAALVAVGAAIVQSPTTARSSTGGSSARVSPQTTPHRDSVASVATVARTTVPVVIRPLDVSYSCPFRGAGWTMTWAWPGLVGNLVAYDLEWRKPGGDQWIMAGRWHDPAHAPYGGGLGDVGAGITTEFRLTPLDADGHPLGEPAVNQVTSPLDPC